MSEVPPLVAMSGPGRVKDDIVQAEMVSFDGEISR